MMDNWNPPSLAAAEKLPCIEISGDGGAQRFQEWIDKNETLPRTIPPLFRDFVVKHFTTFFDPRKDAEPRKYEYLEIVHYSDDLASLAVCHVLNGKKAFIVVSDYASYEGVNVKACIHATASTRFKESWFQTEGVATIYTVLAVQAYILYHRPEEVEVLLPAPKAKKRKEKQPKQPRTKTILQKTRKYIRVEPDEIKPHAKRNYRAIQWNVRGHYRRYVRPDGVKLVYIAPHLARRGNATENSTATRYVLPMKNLDELGGENG